MYLHVLGVCLPYKVQSYYGYVFLQGNESLYEQCEILLATKCVNP